MAERLMVSAAQLQEAFVFPDGWLKLQMDEGRGNFLWVLSAIIDKTGLNMDFIYLRFGYRFK